MRQFRCKALFLSACVVALLSGAPCFAETFADDDEFLSEENMVPEEYEDSYVEYEELTDEERAALEALEEGEADESADSGESGAPAETESAEDETPAETLVDEFADDEPAAEEAGAAGEEALTPETAPAAADSEETLPPKQNKRWWGRPY